jgi:hypothetical protein
MGKMTPGGMFRRGMLHDYGNYEQNADGAKNEQSEQSHY